MAIISRDSEAPDAIESFRRPIDDTADILKIQLYRYFAANQGDETCRKAFSTGDKTICDRVVKMVKRIEKRSDPIVGPRCLRMNFLFIESFS